MQETRQPWLKFFASDWRSDVELHGCSLAARGLWIECIAIMHSARPYGFLVSPNGTPYTEKELARTVGVAPGTVRKLLDELTVKGVCSRDSEGRLFCRRMVRDEERRRTNRENGRQGGNPFLRKSDNPDRCIGLSESVNPSDKSRVRARAASASAYASASENLGEEREKRAPVPMPLDADEEPPFAAPVVLPPDPTADRARAFLTRYRAMYPRFRSGARLQPRDVLDFPRALDLVRTWEDDAWLDKMAEFFLRCDHAFAAQGNRTVGQFTALASWCDNQLREAGLAPRAQPQGAA